MKTTSFKFIDKVAIGKNRKSDASNEQSLAASLASIDRIAEELDLLATEMDAAVRRFAHQFELEKVVSLSERRMQRRSRRGI